MKVIGLTLSIVMIPVVALAAIGSFSSSTTTPAVYGRNTSSSTGAKGVQGYESGTGTTTRYGVYGSANGTGGIGVQGAGTKFGVYSLGPLGVASGKNLICSRCVTPADTAVTPAVRVYNSVGQSIPNTTGTALTFNTETFDNASLHSTTTNTSRLTAPIAGIYQVSAGTGFGTGTGERTIEIYKNGSFYTWVSRTATTNYFTETNISTLVNLAAGQYVEAFVEQNSGSAQDTFGGDQYTWFAMNWVSP